MPLSIGVPREVFTDEKRVATVPEVVEKLIKMGFRVAVEAGAGDAAQISDDAYRASGAELFAPHYIALQASACEIAAQVEEGLVLLDDALQLVEKTGERWFTAELYRQKGRLLLRQGHSDAAEELYRKALSIAEEQDAKLWVLRAAVSLARLHRDQGRHVEARDFLAPAYGWFTEGFDTPDLKEAKALLGALDV